MRCPALLDRAVVGEDHGCSEAQFIELNGATLEAGDAELFVQYLALAEGKLPGHDFAAWLRDRLRFDASGEIHEARPAASRT